MYTLYIEYNIINVQCTYMSCLVSVYVCARVFVSLRTAFTSKSISVIGDAVGSHQSPWE